MPAQISFPALVEEAYVCHPGSQAGICCAFQLKNPPRSKILPYSCLLCIDLLGDCLITLHFTFADVEISLGREFPGREHFLDDLANFRVALIKESRQLRLRILAEPSAEKTEIY